MKTYTATIPPTLAEKLKEKEMPTITRVLENYLEGGIYPPEIITPSYSEVFDWLMEKGIQILLFMNNDSRNIRCDAEVWSYKIGFTKLESKDTWHEAANAAIEMALTLI